MTKRRSLINFINKFAKTIQLINFFSSTYRHPTSMASEREPICSVRSTSWICICCPNWTTFTWKFPRSILTNWHRVSVLNSIAPSRQVSRNGLRKSLPRLPSATFSLITFSLFSQTTIVLLVKSGNEQRAVLENEKIERYIMKNIPGGHLLFVKDAETAKLIENLYSVSVSSSGLVENFQIKQIKCPSTVLFLSSEIQARLVAKRAADQAESTEASGRDR